jgi:hypothetical protein
MKTRGTVSKKTRFLWLIAAPLFLSAAATILSSFYFLAFPGGFQGGRNPWYNVTIIFNRYTWGEIHTWAGLATIGLVVIHLAIHWEWVTRMVGRISKEISGECRNLSGRSWYNVAVNALIGISFFAVAFSGIVMFFTASGRAALDPFFGWSRASWDIAHTWAGVTMIAAAGLHLAIHWRWAKNVTRKVLVPVRPGPEGSPATETAYSA